MSTAQRAPQRAPDRPPAGPPMGRGPMGMGMMPPAKAKDFRGSGRRLLAELGPVRGRVWFVVLANAIGVALGVSGPYFLGKATDVVFGGVVRHTAIAQPGRGLDVPGEALPIDFGRIVHFLAIVMVLYGLASVFALVQGLLLNVIVQNIVKDLRARMQAKLARLPLAYFDTQPRGELLSRVTNDIDNVGMGLSSVLGQILNSIVFVLGVLVMMLWISPLLALVALVTVPLSLVVTAKLGKRAAARFKAQWAHVGALNGQIEEAFTGHTLVRVLGRRREIRARFDAKNAELYDASFRAQLLSSVIMPSINFIGNLTFVGIAVVGGLRVASGAMRLGGVQAFIQYSRQFTQNLGQIAQVANILQSAVASAERVFELLDADDQPVDATATLPPVTGEVVFDHVSFRYKPEEPLIEDLSLVAKPGQTIAIVGPTGAGKTTLVNLVERFYELRGGRIAIDGVDIAGVSRESVRGQIGMVLQDTWLFGGTIRDNIRYGRPNATDDEIVEAAKATYVDRFVRALPLGYDTVIDEEGGNVSAGEKQLITIARAFLADPAILILDEATSSVDTRTEVLVQQAMAALREGRTSFVIAHRLSTIRNADLLLVMEAGKIVEQGTHAELIAARGAYYSLCSTPIMPG